MPESNLTDIEFPENDRVSGKTIRTSILNLILEDFPDFDVNDSIAVQELNVYREKYISRPLSPQKRRAKYTLGRVNIYC